MTLAPGDDRLNVALCTREFPPDVYSPCIAKRHQHNVDITGSQRIMTNGQRDTRCLTLDWSSTVSISVVAEQL